MALLKLGEAPIQSLTDDTAASRLSRTLFDPVIDALLASHVWRFACRTYELTRNTDGDFLIPADCLRVVKSHGEIQGNKILCPGADTLTIVGMSRVTPDAFPGYFASLAATRLAMEFAYPCWASRMFSECWRRYMKRNCSRLSSSTAQHPHQRQ